MSAEGYNQPLYVGLEDGVELLIVYFVQSLWQSIEEVERDVCNLEKKPHKLSTTFELLDSNKSTTPQLSRSTWTRTQSVLKGKMVSSQSRVVLPLVQVYMNKCLKSPEFESATALAKNVLAGEDGKYNWCKWPLWWKWNHDHHSGKAAMNCCKNNFVHLCSVCFFNTTADCLLFFCNCLSVRCEPFCKQRTELTSYWWWPTHVNSNSSVRKSPNPWKRSRHAELERDLPFSWAMFSSKRASIQTLYLVWRTDYNLQQWFSHLSKYSTIIDWSKCKKKKKQKYNKYA